MLSFVDGVDRLLPPGDELLLVLDDFLDVGLLLLLVEVPIGLEVKKLEDDCRHRGISKTLLASSADELAGCCVSVAFVDGKVEDKLVVDGVAAVLLKI